LKRDRGLIVKDVGRGLAAALAISVAAHAALLLAPWSRAARGASTASAASVIEMRVLDPGTPQQAAATNADAVNEPTPADVAVTETPRSESSILPAQLLPSTESAASPSPLPDSKSASAVPRRTDIAEGRDPISSTAADTISGLDRGPRPLDDIEPAFPAAAGVSGGVVTLHLVISAQGVVESIEVVASSPPGLFDAAAIAAFGHARFAPGLKAGVPVRSEIRYEVSFAPIGRGTDASGRTY
jgi:protein TonB